MSMSDELYQQMILEHNKRPRNFGKPEDYNLESEGFNPLCGDHYWVYVKRDVDGNVQSVFFEGSGCAISKSSASMMTEFVKGKPTADVVKNTEEFLNLLKGDSGLIEKLGKLKVFSGIWKFPSRVKCAGLCWHTLKSALLGGNRVTTE